MRYGAALIVEAERPGCYQLGRFTYRARPVSAPVMLRLHAATARGDAAGALVALAAVLRAAFPRRWWYVGQLDPVRRILALPDDLRQLVLDTLFRVPGTTRDALTEDDPVERLRRQQRAQVYGADEARGPAPTLATAAIYVERELGASWYFAPDRWQTVDGYAPFGMVWAAYIGLQTVAARDRLDQAHAALIAAGGKGAQRLHDDTVRAAYPSEPRPFLVS